MIQDELWFYGGYPEQDPVLPNANNHDYPGDPRCKSFLGSPVFSQQMRDRKLWSTGYVNSPSLYRPQLTRYWVPTEPGSHIYNWQECEWFLPETARAVLLLVKNKTKVNSIATLPTEVLVNGVITTEYNPLQILSPNTTAASYSHCMDSPRLVVQERVSHITVPVFLDLNGRFQVYLEGAFLQYPGQANDASNTIYADAYSFQMEFFVSVLGYWTETSVRGLKGIVNGTAAP